MRLLLINPPVGDPTCPYHSLPHLKAYLEARSQHTATIRDLNIEWLHFLMEPEQVARLSAIASRRKSELEAQAQLDVAQQLAYHRLLDPAPTPTARELAEAVAIFRDPVRFYDVKTYWRGLVTMRRFHKLLTRVSYPGIYECGQFSVGPWRNPSRIRDIVEPLSDEVLGLFLSFLHERFFSDIARNPPEALGISMNYRFQYFHGMALARELRQVLPGVRLLLGGTGIHTFFKDVDDVRMLYPLVEHFDVVVAGEGEQPLVDILDTWSAGEPRASIDNAAWPDRVRKEVIAPPNIRYHSVQELPPPDYSDTNFELYLSPEPHVSYSPTRGCYWDRCTFCDYGLSRDKPTAPWRAVDVTKVIEDLRELRRYARFVYFAVDALIPQWMLAIAKAIHGEGLDVIWGAEVRLERRYTEQDAELLVAGGARALSAGLESGCDRILKLINKGTTVKGYDTVLSRFGRAGLAIYPMYFMGFPGEAAAEAHETLDMLERNRDHLALISVPPSFYLEGASIIARSPEKFGLRRREHFSNLDIHNGWYWEGPNPPTEEERAKIWERIHEIATNGDETLLGRPFLGGIDTPHSNMYITRFGPRALKDAYEQLKTIAVDESAGDVETCFDLSCIERSAERLDERLCGLYRELLCPTAELLETLRGELPQLSRLDSPVRQHYQSRKVYEIDNWIGNNFSRDWGVLHDAVPSETEHRSPASESAVSTGLDSRVRLPLVSA